MSHFSAFPTFSATHSFNSAASKDNRIASSGPLSHRARFLATTAFSTVALCMLFGLGGAAHACTPGPGSFCVITGLDDGTGQPGTLSAAINSANANGGGTIEIDDNFVNQVDITGDMPLINFNNPNASTTIVGNGATIDGGGQNRIFFADAGNVVLSDMTLVDGHAEGGDGGDAGFGDGSGGGGGMGAGGALFVNQGAVVNGSNVNFEENNATGGDGGDGSPLSSPGVFSGGAGENRASSPTGGGGGGGLGGDGGDGLAGAGGGGGFNGDGGTSDVPYTNSVTTIFMNFTSTLNGSRSGPGNGGGGGGGGGLNGDGGEGRLGGGGGGSENDGGNGGGFDCVRVNDYNNFIGTETCSGNTGGGGAGGGEVLAGDDAPTGTVTGVGFPGVPVINAIPNIAPTEGDGGNGDTANGILGGDTPANIPSNCNLPATDGADGDNGTTIANNGVGGGGGSRAGIRSIGINISCSPGTDGGDGGNANSATTPDDYSAGGGGGGGSVALANASDNVGGGDGGDGGDGGKYAGGGGGGSSSGRANTSTVDVDGGNGGNGGDGGDYAGGGGAGGSDFSAATPASGGTGGDYGGGGGSSSGIAGTGGYGGGGGASSYGQAGDGGFGGGGGGAGAAVNNPSNPTVLFQGSAGNAGFGAGAGSQANAGVVQGFNAGGSAGGGGGLGAGGAVFVRDGGMLNLTYSDNSDYLTNGVDGGQGGTGSGPAPGTGGNGQARGQAYFLHNNRMTLSVADDFTVRYDDTIDDAREIGGAGGMDKYDCGTMQFGVDGNPTLVMPYGDDTHIYEGEFNVQNNARVLYSTTNIAQSGGSQNNNCAESPLLSGTGTMADTNILLSGRHNVGNAPGDIGNMTVVGDYVVADGGILEVDVAPVGTTPRDSDTIIVRDRDFSDADHTANPLPTGLSATDPNAVASTVVIDPGAILRVMFQVGTYNNNDEWLLIDNEESDKVTTDGTTVISETDILGGFAAVSHNLGFGNVEVETNGNRGGISDGNNVVLRFFGPLCDLTFNQNSTLGGSVTLDSLGQTSVAFNNLPDELKCPTLDTMSGEAHVSAAGMLLERSMALTGSIATRVAASWMQDGPAITGVRASQWLATWKRPEEVAAAVEREEAGLVKLPRSVDMAENPEQYPDGWGAPLEEPEKTTVWGRMLGDFRFVSGDGNAADAFRHGAGMMVGADTKTSEHTRLGIAVGVGRDWIGVDERRGSSITVDSISASLYGSYTKEAWQAMIVGSVAHQMWETERRILFPDNSIDRTAKAEYDAFYWAVRGELGYMHLADNGWLIRPSATARWAELHTDGFRETGAGDINLQNDGEVYRSIQTSLGLRASRERQLDNGWMRTFQLKGEWLHQWSDHYQEATFVFEGGGSPTAPTTQTPFQIRSPEESPASALLGLGLSFTNEKGMTGFVTGDAILSPTTIHPSLAAGLKLRF